MNSKLLFLIIFSIPLFTIGQIKIIENATSTQNVDGQTFTISGNPASIEFVGYFLVVNEGSTDLDLQVRRTEIDVLPGTENATCWKVCPAAVLAGTEPVQMSFTDPVLALDTNFSFSAHYYLNGLDGCSLFKYEWVDANDHSNVYATIFIRFTHNTATSCNVSVEDYSSAEFKLFPNPANDVANLSIAGITGDVEYEVVNLLGQRSKHGKINVQNATQTRLNVADLNNGVYFITFKSNNKVIKTQKLVVKH